MIFEKSARWAGCAVLVGHGLIHLMGITLLWRLGEPNGLRYADVSPAAGSKAGLVVGALWLTSAALFVLAALLLVARKARWRAVALVAVTISVPVLLPSFSMVAGGLVVDAAVAFVVIASWSARRARRTPASPSIS